jgi:hypothetical protein
MIKYNTVYRGQFANQEVDPVTNLSKDVVVTVDIYDTTSGVAVSPTNIIPLEMAGQPIMYESVDNDEDKFKAIVRSIRATVGIHSSDSIGIETFVDGGDTRFFGHIYCDSVDFIIGPVSVGDIQEDFQPDPNVISLIVTDGFGFAADEELTDDDGNIPTGTNSLWTYLRWAFLKTGQSLEAIVVYNIREKAAQFLNAVDSELGHFLKHEYVEAGTWEGENPGTRINALEVIKRILFGCLVTQYAGKWLILSIDEMQGDSDYSVFEVDEDGVFANAGTESFEKVIADTQKMSWMDDDTVVYAERPLKRLDLKFLYEYPREIPCNIDFARGTGAAPTGAASETIDYTASCWTLLREGVSNVDLDTAPFAGSTGVLRKLFEYNYEKERYFVVGTAGGFRHYMKSEAIRMEEKSTLRVGFQWRSATDTAGVTANVAHMRLVGDDGSLWDWNLTTGGASSWVSKVPTDPVFNDVWQDSISGIDDSEWQPISATSQPAPVAGKLYIRLLNDLASPLRHFNGLTTTYTPLVNGSYAKYTGQQYSVEQTGDVKAKREDRLWIDSAPDRAMKGSLQKRGANLLIFSGTVSFGNAGQFEISGDHRAVFQPYIGEIIVIAGSASNDQEAVITSINYSIIGNVTTIFTNGTTTTELSVVVTVSAATYVLAQLFYASQVLPDGPFEDAQSKPYGENVAFNIWNQYNRVMRKFEGKVDGLETGELVGVTPPHFIHKYRLNDADINTGTRIFMLLHFKQNLHLCEWNPFFHEVHDPAQGKSYTGGSFKYLTEAEQ